MGHSRTFTHEIKKIYWMIGELGKLFKIAPSNIRYWDDQFLISHHRDKKGNRRFSREEVERLYLVYYLVEDVGMSIKGVKKALDLLDSRSIHTPVVGTVIENLQKAIPPRTPKFFEDPLDPISGRTRV